MKVTKIFLLYTVQFKKISNKNRGKGLKLHWFLFFFSLCHKDSAYFSGLLTLRACKRYLFVGIPSTPLVHF